MAEYNYREYNTQERRWPGTKTPQAWDSAYGGAEANAGGWNKTGFASNGEGYRDHVCRPVIIDAEGNKRPLISCDYNHETDGVVTKTDTRIEHVHAPSVTGYHYDSPANVTPMKGYGVVNNGWGSPSSPSPTKDYGVVNNGWGRPRSPSHDRPQQVHEFLSKVQTEASQPSKTGIVSSTFWRQTPNSKAYSGTTGYGGKSDDTNGWTRPSGNTIRQPNFDGSYGRSEMVPEYVQEPPMITTGGWNRPSRAAWATPPSYDSGLTKPTHDIGTAVDYLKEAAMSPSVTMTATQPRWAVPRLDTSTPTIDGREAARRYGFSASSQAVKTTETYTSTIDSKELARRYQGKLV